MRVLYVEDSASLRETVSRAMQHAGHVVEVAADGEEGATLALSRPYDVAVIDVMLPKRDGIALLELMRAHGCEVPVLLLTARTRVADRVAGLERGADDYLGKPFALDELLARMFALARRFSGRARPETNGYPVTLHTAARVATCGDHAVKLRPREYALLEYLVRRKGTVVSRAELEAHMLHHGGEPVSNVVDAAISILRGRLAAAGALVSIQTIRGCGYRVSPESMVSCVPSSAD